MYFFVLKKLKKVKNESHLVVEQILEKVFIVFYSLFLKNNKEIINVLIKIIDDVLCEEIEINVIKAMKKNKKIQNVRFRSGQKYI